MVEIHLTKKDFKIEWFSGTGSGGQHRNKHQNCCRITHVDTGISVVGTESRERPTNQRTAFRKLAMLVVAHLTPKEVRVTHVDVIRNYNQSRNEVHDKASGLKQPYVLVVDNLSPMIEARRSAMTASAYVPKT